MTLTRRVTKPKRTTQMIVWTIVLTTAGIGAVVALGSTGSRSHSDNVLRIIRVMPGNWKTLPTSLVKDEPFMTITAGQGARVGDAIVYQSADRRVTVDAAAYETVTLKLDKWPVDEFMYFVEGRVQITDARGVTRTYGPGDAIVMPKGFSGTWHQLAPIRKISLAYSNLP